MSFMTAVDQALGHEKAEMNFYLIEALRAHNPMTRSIFDSLSKDEAEHMTRMMVLRDRLQDQGEWPDDVSVPISDANINAVFAQWFKQGKTRMPSNTTDIQALKKAVDFKAQGAKFYLRLSEASENPMENSFFRLMAGIERSYQLSLTDSLSYLEDPDEWMMQHERRVLDGA